MELEELQNQIDQIMNEQNNRSISEFEGYSPFEMHNILHFTFGPNSPLSLQKLGDSDYIKIPMLNQIRYFLDLIEKSGELKLTAKGYLPTKIVKDIFDQEYLEKSYVFLDTYKVYKESDSMTVNLTRILSEISGLVKKRNGKLSLTKKGENLKNDNEKLLRTILDTFTSKFNWAFYDMYGENQIGQLGYGFSMILLSKYGKEKQSDVFYAEKYFKAFPQLLELIEPTYGTLETYSSNCYSLRTFERFLNYFGLIEIEKQGDWQERKLFITKTELFDKLIKVRSHTRE